MIELILFFVLSVGLFFLSRKTINTCFYFFSRFLHHPQAAYHMIAALYFPGTLIHEMSHLIMAMILNLKVRDMTLIPRVQGNVLKLGTVWYEKKDVVRGLIVGIAPFFAAMYIFWLINAFNFLSGDLIVTAIFSYVVFTISSTMFSSKQDLIDLVYVVPIIIIVGITGYVLKIDLRPFAGFLNLHGIQVFLSIVNSFLIFSLLLNAGIIMVLTLLMKLKK